MIPEIQKLPVGIGMENRLVNILYFFRNFQLLPFPVDDDNLDNIHQNKHGIPESNIVIPIDHGVGKQCSLAKSDCDSQPENFPNCQCQENQEIPRIKKNEICQRTTRISLFPLVPFHLYLLKMFSHHLVIILFH